MQILLDSCFLYLNGGDDSFRKLVNFYALLHFYIDLHLPALV